MEVRFIGGGNWRIRRTPIGIDYNQLSPDHDHDDPYSTISWRKQVIRWRGDDICFVLDQCVVLNFKLLANINSNQ